MPDKIISLPYQYTERYLYRDRLIDLSDCSEFVSRVYIGNNPQTKDKIFYKGKLEVLILEALDIDAKRMNLELFVKHFIRSRLSPPPLHQTQGTEDLRGGDYAFKSLQKYDFGNLNYQDIQQIKNLMMLKIHEWTAFDINQEAKNTLGFDSQLSYVGKWNKISEFFEKNIKTMPDYRKILENHQNEQALVNGLSGIKF